MTDFQKAAIRYRAALAHIAGGACKDPQATAAHALAKEDRPMQGVHVTSLAEQSTEGEA